jgi:alpha-tubulin suppressor-like RCC1 family protein
MVAAGAASCAILDDDSVKCWGSGAAGQLGYGNGTGEVLDPATVGTVDLGQGRKAASIDAAADHVCVILTTGGVMCWGGNTAGKLGYGYNSSVTQNIGDDETPASVGTVDLGGHSALKVTGGDNHTCALLDDHTVRCWGTPYRGINGDPTGHEHDSPPAEAVDLGARRTAIDLEAAADHTCAVLDDHTVRCWGFGDDGRLGYGNTDDVGDDETPGSAGPVNLGSGRTAVAVSAGRWSSCALMDDGNVRCWGAGSELGYGDNTSIGDDETPDMAGPVPLVP